MGTNITAIELLLTVFLLLVDQGQCEIGRSYLDDKAPEFTEPLKNLTVQMGRNATFTCHVDVKGTGYRVSWVKADTRAIQAIGSHKITQNPRIKVISGVKNHRVKHHLIITNATLEEDGPYMCQLNTPTMKSQIGFLTVYKKADIKRVSGAEGIVEGGEARLKCEAEGYPKPTVYWTREEKNHPIILKDHDGKNKREVVRVKNATLVLSKISRSQMGNYLCIAKNRYSPPISHRIMVNVNFRPVIIVETPKVYARLGQEEPVVLECLIEAFPQGFQVWEHNRGGPLTDANGKYSIAQYDFGQYTTRFRLTIHDFSVKDVGSYQCICSNPISTRVEGDVRIELHPEPEKPSSTTTETEYFINEYTEYGNEYIEYQEGMDRSKGRSTTFIIKGRTPPSYDISNINSRRKDGSLNTYYSTTGNGKGKKDQEDTQKSYKERKNQKQIFVRQNKNKPNPKKTNGGNQISMFGINVANSELPDSKCAYFLITAAALMLSSNISTLTYLTNSFNFLF